MRNFEDDPTLSDLLPPPELVRLLSLLSAISGSTVTLTDQAAPETEPVEFNLETLGWVKTGLLPAQHEAAARLFEFILRYVAKYRLAANLHHDTTEASFAELQRQNEALQVSESRYRMLSEQLQERVDEQVGIIKKTQQQLYEDARLRSVGQLAAGMAHEINNPIGFVASNLRVAGDYIDEIVEKLPADHGIDMVLTDFRELIDESVEGAQRVAKIVADLKTFSNIDQADFMACDLNALMTTASHLVQANNPTLDILLNLNELPTLMGYPAKLSQVFYNLLDNAIKAGDSDNQIRIETSHSGNMITLSIEDDGCGIPEAILPQVFDPFFTTREVGSGTGLGLTVARDVVTAHQGEIFLENRLACGTRVTLRFPAP